MKSFEKKPSPENIIETFLNDSIGRTEDVCSFVKLLLNIEGSYSLGIDGIWGTGKTFFVKQSKCVLDALNPNNSFSNTEDGSKIKEFYYKKTKTQEEPSPLVTAYYDAWQHDDEEEPVLSLIYTIMKDNYGSFSEDKRRSWSNILASIAEVLSNRNISVLVKELKGQSLFEEQKQNESLNNLIEEYFESFLPERGNRLVVFIDELDRCSPSFAVKIFERIKHYFQCDNITFVFSVNFKELQKTIKHYYGSDFDSCRYLDRFFDIRMEIPPIDMNKYVKNTGFLEQKNLREYVCMEIIRQMNMSMREVTRFWQMSQACAYHYTDGDAYNEQRFWSHDDGLSRLICFSVIAPIAIGLKITNTEDFDAFINGKNHIWLERIILTESLKDWVTKFLIGKEETYTKTEGKQQVDEKQKITDLYNAVFVKTYDGIGEYETTIGNAVFNKESRINILKAISFVSPYTDLKPYM